MTPILLLSAALAAGQQPPPQQPQQPPPPPNLPKAPADAPRGLPVMLSYVTADAGGRISTLAPYPVQQTRTVKAKDPATGREVNRQEVVTVMEFYLQPLPEKAVRVATLDGKPVSYAEAARRVKGGKVVAVVGTWQGQKADPAYLKALKEDTLVFEMQPEPPPAQPGGAAQPPK